jgi:hypothetical protein
VVEPRFERLTKEVDPARHIISMNDKRRHITAGQRAVAVALIYPQPAKLRRKGSGDLPSKSLNGATLSEAREIVRYPDLAYMVRDGKKKFDHALAEARSRAEAESNAAHYLSTLRADAADLAQMVVQEQLTVGEAWAAFQRRQTEAAEVEKKKRATLLRLSTGTVAAPVLGNKELNVNSKLIC